MLLFRSSLKLLYISLFFVYFHCLSQLIPSYVYIVFRKKNYYSNISLGTAYGSHTKQQEEEKKHRVEMSESKPRTLIRIPKHL